MIHLIAHTPDGLDALLRLPPLHPMFVNFTAALVPAAVVSDLLGRWLGRASLTAVGAWTMLYAAVITPLTAATGWWWFYTTDHPLDAIMLLHMWLGTGLAVVLVLLAVWRWRAHRRDTLASRAYLATAVLVFLGRFLQGHAGAVMSFGPGPEGIPSAVEQPDHPHEDPRQDHHDDRYEWREYIELEGS
jgi:uncharacterized membrane protein